MQLIRERSGVHAGIAARTLFAFRGGTRLALAVVGRMLPGMARLRRERPKAFDIGLQWDQLLWALLPSAVNSRMPELPPSVHQPASRDGDPGATDVMYR